MRILLVLSLLSIAACQVDPPECSALLTCCGELRGASVVECLDAYETIREEAHAGLLCREVSRAYGCSPDSDAGWASDGGFAVDAAAPGFDSGSHFDGGPSRVPDVGSRFDASPTFYPDAGSSSDAAPPSTDSGPVFYPDAGVGYDAGNPSDAGPRSDVSV